MDFDGRGENLLAERRRALVICQSLQEEFDGLPAYDHLGKQNIDSTNLLGHQQR